MVVSVRGKQGGGQRVTSPPFLDQMLRCVRPPARPLGSDHRPKALNDPKQTTETATRLLFDGLVEQKQKASPSSRPPASSPQNINTI